MRNGRKFERVGDHDQVEAGTGEGQRGIVAGHEQPGIRAVAALVRLRARAANMQRNTAGPQQVFIDDPDLECVITKNVGKHRIEPRQFPGDEILAERSLRPCRHHGGRF